MEKKEPWTRMSTLVEYKRLLFNMGVDPSDLLLRAGISPVKAERPTERLSLRSFAELINLTSRHVGDPLFGARLGMTISAQHLGAVGCLITLAPTLRHAIAGAGRYLRIFNEGPSVTLSVSDKTANVAYRLPPIPEVDQRQHCEYVVAACLRLIRFILGEHWQPDRVTLGHDLRVPLSAYEARFGAPIEVRSVSLSPMISFPSNILDWPNQLADPEAHAALERHLAEQLRIGQSSEDLLALMRHEISRRLLGGESDVTVATIAKSLGFSVRTLQRRLFERNTSFDELVDDIRKDWARRYLEDERLTISDIAYLLGYGELSSFTRAFQRWTGDTPRDYRRAMISNVA
ncbi:MAG: AraC family transcriptional regulator [Pseudomonadota bacterium]